MKGTPVTRHFTTMMKHILYPLLWVMTVSAADLPIQEVVLYKHGIGYFVRSGKLARGESARLEFNASEMNDVLKSLTVAERGAGAISGLRYDAMDPLSHRLAGFPFQIESGEPLSAVLDRLKGARLELEFGGNKLAGVIVNGRVAAGGERQPEREQLTLMLDSGELRTVDLGAATAIRFADPRLQQQFREYLGATAAARSREKRAVYIDSSDAGEREVVAHYTIPVPVWKSSYRLIFGAARQPVLEGWAIVDNTTGEDWTGVRLSLVSGRPISFVSQLYPPRYVERPGAELPEEQAARPVLHEGAFEAGNAVAQLRAGSGASAGAVAGFAPAPQRKTMARPNAVAMDAVAAPAPAPQASPSSIAAAAQAGELGELFEYRVAQPVTIRRDESAMLPFLQQPIEARKLLIYTDHSSEHPTNAAEITNGSGKTLDGGPITVYDGGAYGGEALMETVKAGDRRLISYAVDLGTRITEAFGSKQAIMREIHVSRGILTAKMAVEETRTYTVRNVDQKTKTLIVEHPLRPGYSLLNQKPVEKTPAAYRFELQLAAGASREFPVSEERILDQTYSVANLTPDVLVAYARNTVLGDAGRAQLQKIADQKSQIAEADRALRDIEAQTGALTADEERLRRNIASLNAVSGQQQQVQEYARQLAAAEQQMAGLRDRRAAEQRRKSSLESELNRMIEALSF